MTSSSFFSKFVLLGLLFCSYTSLSQSKLIVDQNGNGDYTTIQAAVDQAALSDTIFVNEGIYYENVYIIQDVVLIGQDPLTTIIDAQDTMKCISVRVTEENSRGSIKNLGIRNAGNGYSNGTGNCGILLKGPVGALWNVEGSIFSSNAWNGMVSSINGTLINNQFVDNSAGLFMTQNSTMDIINNTFVDNGTGVFCHNQTTEVEVYNNVFIGNTNALNIDNEEYVTDYNLFWNNVNDFIDGQIGTNSIVADPLFDMNSADEYFPSSNSPMINAGMPDISNYDIPSFDFLGNVRIINERIDIGAYEFQEVSSIGNIQSALDIRIYPNPTADYIFIDCDNLSKIELRDINGRLITKTLSNTLDVSALESGFYILSIEIGKQKAVYHKTIVKE